MAKKDRTTLTLQALQIQNETSDKANTNVRIGSMDQDLLDSLVHQDDTPNRSSVDANYADIPAMIAPVNQAQQIPKFIYRVDNAADGGLVGYAYYEKRGTSTGSLSDYILVAAESLVPQNQYDFIPQGSDPAYSEGRLWYGDGSLNLFDGITGTSIQMGKEIVVDIYNDNGATLTNGTVVRYGPAVNGFPGAVRALADTVTNANSFGICTHDIGVGEVGKVVTQGVMGLDTSMWNANDILFLSATVPGGLTNVEQQILKPVGRVLVSATEANGGKLYAFQRDIVNVTALGQAAGEDEVQVITTTPQPLEVYDNTIFELNTTVTQTGAGPYTAAIAPASPGASGFYRVAFHISIVGTANTIHTFEFYLNGQPTGLLSDVDLSNNQIDAGSGSLNVISESVITNADSVEVYVYTASGTSTITAASVSLNMERIGNV